MQIKTNTCQIRAKVIFNRGGGDYVPHVFFKRISLNSPQNIRKNILKILRKTWWCYFCFAECITPDYVYNQLIDAGSSIMAPIITTSVDMLNE